jgi:hypothetical protein
MRNLTLSVFGLILSLTLLVSENRLAQTVAQTTSQGRQLERQADAVKVWPTESKRWALIVGVNQYRDAQIDTLRGSVNDAHGLANALINYAGFPPDQVIVLSSDAPDERQPTRINILTYLSNLAALVPKDGLFLFSFAGHGIERGGQAFLIPSDARLSRDISLLEESAVSVTRMHDRIKAIGVGQVIVLLDACRNDPGGRSGAPNNMTAAFTKFNFDVRNQEVEAFATLYATAIGQRAYEYTEKKQGYFTWAIVEGLKGAAANEKGEVTLAALLKYVQETVPKRIAINLGPGEQQKPFAIIEGYRADELVIAALPTPELAFVGREPFWGDGLFKYSFKVTNLRLFSNEMFAAPCWDIRNSSRTSIDVYDENDQHLQQFCGIKSADGLAGLSFLVSRRKTQPASIYIVLTDRQQQKSYRSAPLVIPRP